MNIIDKVEEIKLLRREFLIEQEANSSQDTKK